ncbi:MAG: glycosyltransferase family 2 protein [Clostridiales bacterium]|jgi:glycosyltransferase involved in cell wall biosynthesis|nr:glycosyltransferase family 2 protein [Clostridiales bacterium]
MVSIVMPCYNKGLYIGEMLESIINQDWDDIELILVNDGSTDNTSEVIESYIPRIKARGYKLRITDQANAGCRAAVKTGLAQVTGDYLCIIDPDDVLSPQYVSAMAGWLSRRPEYDFVSCDSATIENLDGIDVIRPFYSHGLDGAGTLTPEYYLTHLYFKATWNYMIRKLYFDRCRILDMFETSGRGSYEPPVMIPLSVNKGRMKHFSAPLYFYRINDGGLSQTRNLAQADAYWTDYHQTIEAALSRIDTISEAERSRLSDISAFYRLKILIQLSIYYNEPQNTARFIEELSALTKNQIPKPNKGMEIVFGYAAELFLLRREPEYETPEGRVIGCGSKGKAASKLLPLLKGTAFEPDMLWDAQSGFQDFQHLTPTDTILILPTKQQAVDEIKTALKGARVQQVLGNEDIYKILAREYLAAGVV